PSARMNTRPVISDATVAAARAGDLQAVREIYLALSPVVLGYLRAKGIDDAEDCASEVFVALIPRLPTVHGGAQGLRTLVFSIAHARLVDDLRARARRPSTVAYDPSSDARAAPSAEHTAHDNWAEQRVLA